MHLTPQKERLQKKGSKKGFKKRKASKETP
ncbi:hypothetical protein L933_03570 [Helicobacter pylori PZ5056]|uniref:Uncharacterized protein n=1 Tax=Helicobacter pylori PZ5056 TaxID=1337393 RepID=T2T3P5_HELPX|nr:hypothetical protein L933_03570 [Helicobacter pylori PZ5056]